MRFASLINDKTDFVELQSKVDKIIQITGASSDVAAVALHDNDNELDKAIDKILEGVFLNEAEWHKTGKKKKPKSNVSASQPEPSVQKSEEKSSSNREKKAHSNRGRDGQRLQRGALNKVSWKQKEEKHNITNNDNNENIAPEDVNLSNIQSRRGDNRRGRGRGFNRSNFGGKSNEKSGRNSRTFQNKGYRNVNEGFSNSIDTWTNSTADQASGNKAASGDCTTMTVGNWSDFAGNEDWSEEDWDSNVIILKYLF